MTFAYGVASPVRTTNRQPAMRLLKSSWSSSSGDTCSSRIRWMSGFWASMSFDTHAASTSTVASTGRSTDTKPGMP